MSLFDKILGAKNSQQCEDTPNEFLKLCSNGKKKEVERMLKRKPDLIDCVSEGGYTGLMSAITYEHDNVAEFLIDSGAKTFIRDPKFGFDALLIASLNKRKNVVKKLLKVTSLVNVQHSDGTTAMMLAIGDTGSSYDIVAMLIEAGCDINRSDNHGSTALHNAARVGRKDIVELLIKKGANPNLRGFWNELPFEAAERNGHKEVANYLRAKTRR